MSYMMMELSPTMCMCRIYCQTMAQSPITSGKCSKEEAEEQQEAHLGSIEGGRCHLSNNNNNNNNR